jgi:hypothetical protein
MAMVKQDSTTFRIGKYVRDGKTMAELIGPKIGLTENSVKKAVRDYRAQGEALQNAADAEKDAAKKRKLQTASDGSYALAQKIEKLLPKSEGGRRGRQAQPELSIDDILSLTEGMELETEDTENSEAA